MRLSLLFLLSSSVLAFQSAAAAPAAKPGKPAARPPQSAPPRLVPDLAPEPTAPYRDDQPKGNGIDFRALIRETQKGSSNPSRMTLIWWVPEDYWRASFMARGDYNEATAEEFYRALRPYTMVLVMDGRHSENGQVVYRPDTEVRSELMLRGMDGVDYRPIRPEQISEEAKTLIELMRPVFTNLLGPLGQNIRIYYFPARNKEGKPLTDPRASGLFSVFLGNREYRWRLPLSTVMPARKCPTCAEALSGAFKFCPYDGAKLSEPAN